MPLPIHPINCYYSSISHLILLPLPLPIHPINVIAPYHTSSLSFTWNTCPRTDLSQGKRHKRRISTLSSKYQLRQSQRPLSKCVKNNRFGRCRLHYVAPLALLSRFLLIFWLSLTNQKQRMRGAGLSKWSLQFKVTAVFVVIWVGRARRCMCKSGFTNGCNAKGAGNDATWCVLQHDHHRQHYALIPHHTELPHTPSPTCAFSQSFYAAWLLLRQQSTEQ